MNNLIFLQIFYLCTPRLKKRFSHLLKIFSHKCILWETTNFIYASVILLHTETVFNIFSYHKTCFYKYPVPLGYLEYSGIIKLTNAIFFTFQNFVHTPLISQKNSHELSCSLWALFQVPGPLVSQLFGVQGRKQFWCFHT